MKLKFLLPLIVAMPANASDPKELPDLWYDLIVAEELATLVVASCPEYSADEMVAYRFRNIATGDLAKFDIHRRTPTKPMTIVGFALASIRVGNGVPLTDDICDFAKIHIEQQTGFGSRLKRADE